MRWPNSSSATSRTLSSLDCSAARAGMAAAWKRKYGTFFAALRLKNLVHPAGWGKNLLLCSPKLASKPTFPNCVDPRLSPSSLSSDYSRHECAFGADAPTPRPERGGLARPAAPDVDMDDFGDGL